MANVLPYWCFNLVLSLVYAMGMRLLARELRASSEEERRENQTVPLMIVSTITYGVVAIKTYQLMQMCGVL